MPPRMTANPITAAGVAPMLKVWPSPLDGAGEVVAAASLLIPLLLPPVVEVEEGGIALAGVDGAPPLDTVVLYPGTDLAEISNREGRTADETWEDDHDGDGS